MNTIAKVIAGVLGLALVSACDLPGAAQSDDAAAAGPAATYEAQTLDGRMVTFREGDGELGTFTDGMPSEMQSIHALAQQGACNEIWAAREHWAKFVDESDGGMKASAITRLAGDVHAFIRCPPVAPSPGPARSSQFVDPRFDTCGEANNLGFGNYVNGVDPEYGWYVDDDADGVACER